MSIQSSKQSRNNSGFTLIELLVVIAIISILATMLIPALKSAKGLAQTAGCMNNIRQLHFSFHQYQQDYNDVYPHYWYNPPAVKQWNRRMQIAGYIEDIEALFCPSGNKNDPRTNETKFYEGWIDYGMSLGLNYDLSVGWDQAAHSLIHNPQETIVALDCRRAINTVYGPNAGWNWSYWGYTSTATDGGVAKARHEGNKCNVLWADGHVSSVEQPDPDLEASLYWPQALGSIWYPSNYWDRK